MWQSVLPAWMSMNKMCAVFREARRRCQVPLKLESQIVVNYHEGAEPRFSGRTAVVLTTASSLHPQISEAMITACLPCFMSWEAGFYVGAFHTTKLPSISKQVLMFSRHLYCCKISTAIRSPWRGAVRDGMQPECWEKEGFFGWENN